MDVILIAFLSLFPLLFFCNKVRASVMSSRLVYDACLKTRLPTLLVCALRNGDLTHVLLALYHARNYDFRRCFSNKIGVIYLFSICLAFLSSTAISSATSP